MRHAASSLPSKLTRLRSCRSKSRALERSRPQRHLDHLRLHVRREPERTDLTAEARLLESAEWHVRLAADMVVDPDRAGLDLFGDRLAAVEVVGPDRSAQAVA